MAYTFKTEQFGLRGAIGTIFKNGVCIWSSNHVQAFGLYDSDRKRAGRTCRERIRDMKQLDAIRAHITGRETK